MAGNGSPRRRTPARRALVNAARIAALLAIIIGAGGLLVPALAYRPPFYAAALVFAVVSFVLLRPPRRDIFPPNPVLLQAPPPEPMVVVDHAQVEAARDEERQRWQGELSRSLEAIRRTKQELGTSEEARAALTRNIEEMTETILAQRSQIATQNASNAQQLVRADTLIAELNTELTAARQTTEELRLQHAREMEKLQHTTAQREAELTERYRKAFENRESEHQRDVSQRVTQINELQRALESERGIREQVATLAREMQQQLTAAAAAQGELHGAMDREKAARLAAETRVAELEQALEAERVARERMDAHAHDLAARVDDLERRAVTTENEWTEKLAGITADHEKERGALAARIAELEQTREAERDAARVETRELAAKLAGALEQRDTAAAEARVRATQVEEVETRIAAREKEWDEKLQQIVAGMAADHEEDIGKATMEREAARAEARHLTMRLEHLERQIREHRSAAVDEAALREAIDAEWGAKLQTIVAHLASDHDADVGKAVEEKEAAKAEARRLTIRVQELERQIEEHRSAAVDEAALRETIDAEWGAKLQTIVAHLASDHDADVGKAVEEKEAAKAEARTLSMKLNALQQQIDRDRQMFLSAQEKWNAMRESLIAKAEAAAQPAPVRAEEGPFPTVSVPTPDPFGSPFASANIDPQRARADVLEFAEQAHAVLKRTAPGTIPIPQASGSTVILFVHHDPAMRTMWRDQLQRQGYEVITAADGLEALRLANAQNPAVVIADAQMPKMDGRELCRLLKSNEATASTKVVLMSAMHGDEPADGAFPPDELMPKPVKFEALQAALANLLTVHH